MHKIFIRGGGVAYKSTDLARAGRVDSVRVYNLGACKKSVPRWLRSSRPPQSCRVPLRRNTACAAVTARTRLTETSTTKQPTDTHYATNFDNDTAKTT